MFHRIYVNRWFYSVNALALYRGEVLAHYHCITLALYCGEVSPRHRVTTLQY